MQVVALDQPLEGCREHRLIAGRGVWPVGAGEGNSVTADDRDAAQLSHEKLLMNFFETKPLPLWRRAFVARGLVPDGLRSSPEL